MYELLRYIEIPVSYVLVGWYKALTFLGLDGASGWTWGLAIVGLVITIRVILIPLFVRQIKAQRAMQLLAPDLKKVQEKYKGKKDQASREAMSRETMELYKKHKTNPFSSCLPLLVQSPIFFALFRVLNTHLKPDADGVFQPFGALSADLAQQAHDATIFGAGLSQSFNGTGELAVKVVAAVLIVAMVATTFLTQRQLTRKNMPASALEGPAAQQQKLLMYMLPVHLRVLGAVLPDRRAHLLDDDEHLEHGSAVLRDPAQPHPRLGGAPALSRSASRAKAKGHGDVLLVERARGARRTR